MADFLEIVDKTFKFEGGYQAFPKDSANYTSKGDLVGTNNGISAQAYETYLKRVPTVADMKAITKDIARDVYKKGYWDANNISLVKNQSVAWLMFDAIIANISAGRKLIRIAINQIAGANTVPVGTKPLTASEINLINTFNQAEYFNFLHQGRENFFNSLYKTNPDKYGQWIKGWLARLDKIVFTPQFVEPDSLPTPEGVGKKKST